MFQALYSLKGLFCAKNQNTQRSVNDQIENARQIERLKIGKRICAFPTRQKEIANAVEELLNNTIYKSNVCKLKEDVQKTSDWNATVSQIERLCEI